MAKKRKTRKEKELRQRRRSAVGSKASRPVSSPVPEKQSLAKDTSRATKVADEKDENQLLRMKSMKYSLMIFGGLVIFQIAVWLSAQTDILPSGWADILVS